MREKKNFYQTLGLLNVADDVVIKAAYKALAQKHHPDKHKSNKEFHTQVMADLNEAYAAIGTKARRKAYDDAIKRSAQAYQQAHAQPKPKANQSDQSPQESLIERLQNSAMDEMAVVALFEKIFASDVSINAGWMNTYTFKQGKQNVTLDFTALKSKIIQKLKQP